jgi:hypothetical protein
MSWRMENKPKILGAILVLVLGAAGGCASGELGLDVDSRSEVFPLSFEAPDGTVALAGEYDPESGTILLDDAVLAWTSRGGSEIVLWAGEERIAVDANDAEVALATALQIGDELTLSAGEAAFGLVVELPEFEADGAPEELAQAGSSSGCTLSSVQGVYSSSWGCATQPVSGLPQDRLYWNIQDFKTDGYCVQLWAEFYNSGAWFRQGVSCGPTKGGSLAKGSLSERVRTLRLFRTNTSSTVLYDPPGNYMTIYSN